jgi:hypothetical protein
METIKEILMRRDGATEVEADELIQQAKDQMNEYLEDGDEDLAYNICQEFFGLEPDYLMELIF